MKLPLLSRSLLFSSLCVISGINAAGTKETKKMTDSSKTTSTKTAASPKIAVVNVHRIITVDPKALSTASEEWRSLYDKLQETLKPANKEIADLEEKYKKKMSEIDTLQKTGVSSKEVLRKKYEEEVAPLEYQLQSQYQQRERFAQEELAKAQSVIGPKIEKIMGAIQDAQGWDIIIKGDAVLGKVNPKFDITDDVLSALNKQYTEEKAKKAAAAQAKPQVKG